MQQLVSHSLNATPELLWRFPLDCMYYLCDICALENLTNLAVLNLSGHLINIAPLTQLSSLTELNISSNRLTNIDALQNLTQLTKLNMYSVSKSYSKPLDFTVLQYLTQLTYLNIINY